MQLLCVSYLVDSLVGDTVELAVFHINVVHSIGEFLVLVSHYHNAVLALLACHVLHIYVLHRRVESAAAHLFRLVVGVYLQHSLLALSHLNVTEIDVLDDTAAARVCLDAEHALKVGRVHLAVLHKHILATAGNLASYDNTAVTIFHCAVPDDEVAARNAGIFTCAASTSVSIATALYCYTVITRMEYAILDKHILTTLWVTAVSVRSFIPYFNTFHGDVLREQRVDNPERRAQQSDARDENVLALVEVDELRAQSVALAKASLVHRHTVLSRLQQTCTAATVLTLLHVRVLGITFLCAHCPPCLGCGCTVYCSLARDGNVLLLVCVDAWLVVPEVKTFPSCRHERVEVGVELEQ